MNCIIVMKLIMLLDIKECNISVLVPHSNPGRHKLCCIKIESQHGFWTKTTLKQVLCGMRVITVFIYDLGRLNQPSLLCSTCVGSLYYLRIRFPQYAFAPFFQKLEWICFLIFRGGKSRRRGNLWRFYPSIDIVLIFVTPARSSVAPSSNSSHPSAHQLASSFIYPSANQHSVNNIYLTAKETHNFHYLFNM